MATNKSNKTGKKAKVSAKRTNATGRKTTARKASATGRSKKEMKDLKKSASVSVMPKRRTSARDLLDERLDKHKITTTTDNPVPSETRVRK
jgi:hypothetical protein